MNRPIRAVSIVAMLMFLALLANLSASWMWRTEPLMANENNKRVIEAEFGQQRGPIMVGDTAIAKSEPVKDRFGMQRTYPHGDLYADVLGYYSFSYGRGGLEQTFNQDLAGRSSSQYLRQILDSITGAKIKGGIVNTTLNHKATQAASEAIGDRKGAVVALDPKSGAILAMVTKPTYDANQLAIHDLTELAKNWKALNADPDRPMANRAIREIYPPGSTFKLVTTAAALESGLSADTEIKSPNQLLLPGTQTYMGNSSNCGGETTTLANALRVSCNTAFGNLGLEVGADKLRAQAMKFGFGTTLMTDLPSAASRFPKTVDQAQLAMSAIGQYEVAASPLQMAMVAAAIANDGKMMTPYLVESVQAADLAVLSKTNPKTAGQPITPRTARTMQDMMREVVKSGTGRAVAISGVDIGGKTGTAQSDLKRAPYAWFVAWAKNPDVAIAVFIEDANVRNDEISGGRIAAPIAKSVIEALR